VEILYNIVTRAEHDPDIRRLPFKAIFAAYDAVLAERRVNKESDRIWLRCLFKLGDKSRHGTLFEKFERLLGEMGIELAYDEDERERRPEESAWDERGPNDTSMEGSGRIPSDVETPTNARGVVGLGTPTGGSRTRKRRRASFNSMYDVTATADTTRWSQKRPSSRSSVSRLQVGKSPFPERQKDVLRKTQRATSSAKDSHVQTGLGEGNWMSSVGALDDLARQQRKEILEARQQALKHWRPNEPEKTTPTGPSRHTVTKSLGSVFDDNSLDAATSTTLGDCSPVRRVAVPSSQRIRSKAVQSFLHRHRQPVAISAHQQPIQLLQDRNSHRDQIYQAQERRATEHDRYNLLWDAFNRWLTLCRTKRKERIYEVLEGRVIERRNLNLLYGAFDHWIIVTAQERNRTALARRHMLRKKYFKLWRDFTVANEIKAQRFALQQKFDLWRKAYVRIWANEITAIQVHQENLVKKVFWDWFWAYCDSSAPKLRASKVQRSILITWQKAWGMTRTNMGIAEDQYERYLKLSALRKWVKKRQDDLYLQNRADEFRRQSLIRKCVTIWRKQAQLFPLATRVSNMVDWRIARTTSMTWILRTRMARRAAQVDRLRVLRNTWTAWNDRLRWQTLEARIDKRLILQSLYKWVLTSRFNLMKRVHNWRVQQQTLKKLVGGYRGRRTRLEQPEIQIEEIRKRHLAATALDLLNTKVQSIRQKEKLAFDFYSPKIELQSLEAWRTRHQHIQHMEGWARDAEFFFLTKKTIKSWRKAVGESRRLKRREAYAQIRRKAKMNLATTAIEKWHSQMEQLCQNEDGARSRDNDRITNLGIAMLRKWREHASTLQQDVDRADSHYSTSLLNRCLRSWMSQLQHIRDLNVQRDQFSHIHVLELSAPLLRKLRFRIFEIQTRQETADAMNERNHKKHARNMIRHWREQLLPLDPPDFTKSVPSNTQGDLGKLASEGTPARVDDWTAFGDSFNATAWIPALEAQSSTTPMLVPGYLNTPSKRAVRARALAQMSTTPATPLGTPLASRLRNQTSSTRRTGTQRRGQGLGQSRLGVGKGVDYGATLAGEGE
jgi:protein SFI1